MRYRRIIMIFITIKPTFQQLLTTEFQLGILFVIKAIIFKRFLKILMYLFTVNPIIIKIFSAK